MKTRERFCFLVCTGCATPGRSRYTTHKRAKASYKLTVKELYVRAKVTSSKPHPNPYQKGDTEVAWTQPFVP